MKLSRSSSRRCSRPICLVLTLCAVSLTVLSLALVQRASRSAGASNARAHTALSAPDAATRARLNENYGKLPLSFEANQGQAEKQVKFLSRGQGYHLLLTPTEAVVNLSRPTGEGEQTRAAAKASATRFTQANACAEVRMKLVGANPQPRISGQDELPGKSNYFLGNDPQQWRTNVPTYRKVKYEGVYPGVDVVYYGNQRQLEYDFVVAPGADPKAIRLKFSGAKGMRLDAQGDGALHGTGWCESGGRLLQGDWLSGQW